MLRLRRAISKSIRCRRNRHDVSIDVSQMKNTAQKDLDVLPEVVQRDKFQRELDNGLPTSAVQASTGGLGAPELKTLLDASFLTFHLHVESRIAARLGYGYYTIGPCGEELMSTVALSLRPTDASALHYRHVGTAVARQLIAGDSIDDVALARARAACCSIEDPVTSGKHCAIGGSAYDFYVTSTLASQSPAAVGRALGFSVAHTNKVDTLFPRNSVSFVSVGDGSTHNAHFLAAVNLSELAIAHQYRCPVVFCVTNNELCISFKNKGWASRDGTLAKRLEASMEVFRADGNDVASLHAAASGAIEKSRKSKKPTVLLVDGVTRRFGHAATDRQDAYLTQDEIDAAADSSTNLRHIAELCISTGAMTSGEVATRFRELQSTSEEAFAAAVAEPGADTIGRQGLVDVNSAPYMGKTASVATLPLDPAALGNVHAAVKQKTGGRRDVMRKHMNAALSEMLTDRPESVYLGEDVEHGGYYVVTEGLKNKFGPSRVRDFPPDETTLIGAAIGFSQCGLLPVVEIPYAKYLDCGFDMFHEAIMAHWLTGGRQPNGMVIRLQGFDRGVFGGNFHTHNTLYIPPGLDVLCFSNGHDWVKGLRLALDMAKQGRVVMLVDSTALLARRHMAEDAKDGAMLTPYPVKEQQDGNAHADTTMSLDDVTLYCSPSGAIAQGLVGITPAGENDSKNQQAKNSKKAKGRKARTAAPRVAIVTYGNGVSHALAAAKSLEATRGSEGGLPTKAEIAVVDSPCLSRVPGGLKDILAQGVFTHVVFADVCKDSPGMPLGHVALTLCRPDEDKGMRLLSESNGILGWSTIGAAPTYNPLGSLITFLDESDIHKEVLAIIERET